MKSRKHYKPNNWDKLLGFFNFVEESNFLTSKGEDLGEIIKEIEDWSIKHLRDCIDQ